MRTRGFFVVMVAVGLVASLSATGCSRSEAEDFTLLAHDGTPFTLSEHRGEEGVVLFFFASWCAACAEQVEPLQRFAAATADQGIKVVGVSIQEEADTIAEYVKKREITYPVVIDSDTSVAASYGIEGIPTIIAVDRAGQIVFRDHAVPEDTADLASRLTRAG